MLSKRKTLIKKGNINYGGSAGLGRLALVLGGDDKLVVGVVVIGVELLRVGDDTGRVHLEVVVAHRVLDLGVGTRVRVGGFDAQDRCAHGHVLRPIALR